MFSYTGNPNKNKPPACLAAVRNRFLLPERVETTLTCSRVFSEPHQELKAGLSIQKLNTVKKQQSKLLTIYLELCALTLSLICRILFYSGFQFITDQNHTQLLKILNKVTKVISVRNYKHT